MSESCERKLPADKLKKGKRARPSRRSRWISLLLFPRAVLVNVWAKLAHATCDQSKACATQAEEQWQTSLEADRLHATSWSLSNCNGNKRLSRGGANESEGITLLLKTLLFLGNWNWKWCSKSVPGCSFHDLLLGTFLDLSPVRVFSTSYMLSFFFLQCFSDL